MYDIMNGINERVISNAEEEDIKTSFEVFKSDLISNVNANKRFYNADSKTTFFHNIIQCKAKLIGIINIEYYIYFAADDVEYMAFKRGYRNVDLNCVADFNEKKITIRDLYYNGIDEKSLYVSFSHEFHHIYQYFSGFSKTVQQENLYNNVINASKSSNNIIRNIAICLYHTFKHEQDAFCVQLYNELKCNKVDINSISLNDVECMCTNYKYFLDCVNTFKKNIKFGNINSNDIKNSFGISLETIWYKIENGKRLFKEKIKNVWMKYCSYYKLLGHKGMNEHITFLLECEKKGYKMLV